MATRVTVYESQIAAAFLPGRPIFGEVRRVGTTALDAARHFSPKRTGTMAAGIRMNVLPSKKYHCFFTVTVPADYAIYTLRGTTGPIWPTKSAFLWVRPRPFSGYTRYTPRMSVAGQTGKDWLGRALFVAMKAHGLT